MTDPQAAWVAKKGVDPFFAYDANYLIDNKAGIILDAEGTRANRIEEIAVTQTMVERVAPPLRSSAPQARSRHRLWRGQAAQVAGGSQDHPAYSGVGQVGAPRWHLQPSRLRLRPGTQRLHLPGWRRAHQHRHDRSGPHRLLQGQQKPTARSAR